MGGTPGIIGFIDLLTIAIIMKISVAGLSLGCLVMIQTDNKQTLHDLEAH